MNTLDSMYPALACLPEKSEPLGLPGSGMPAAGCGRRIPKHCKTHEGEFWGRSHCNERACPNCYERWAAKEAQRASLKVAWGAKYWQDRRATILSRKIASVPLDPVWPPKRLLVSHFVISMPSDLGLWIHGWSPEKARTTAYEIARRHRVCGGIVVFHPWRRDDDLCEYIPDGYWHFHIIGIHFVPTTSGGTDIAPDGRPVIFKQIRDDEYENFGGLRSQLAISRVIQYQLTHAGLQAGEQALTYFGLLHFSKVPREKLELDYPACLTDDSKTNPAAPLECPACGSEDIEPCTETLAIFADGMGLEDVQRHPEPAYEPMPELVDEARRKLESDYQSRYDDEPLPAARHALTKERQHERMKLAQRELELFNMANPLVQIWVWLRAALSEGPVPRDYLNAEDPSLLDRCIELNLKTGRLGITKGERLYLKHEYGLDDALREVRDIVKSGEPDIGRDLRLERLLIATSPEDSPILTDTGFIFGDTLNRLIETKLLGKSSQPDQKIEDASFMTADGEVIEPGHLVGYLRKQMRAERESEVGRSRKLVVE